MSISDFFRAFCAAFSLALSTTGALAGGAIAGATEPTQILNNLELLKTASDGAITAQKTVQQYATQLHQYQVQLQNIAKLSSLPAGLGTDAVKAVNDLMRYKSALEALEGSLAKQTQTIEQRVTEARLGGKGWGAYTEAVSADVAANQARAVQRLKNEEAVLKQVEADYTFARDLQTQIPATVGQHQSLQLLNTQMNRLVTQNAKLLEVVSGTLNERGRREASEAESRARTLAAQAEIKQRQDAINDRQLRFGGWK